MTQIKRSKTKAIYHEAHEGNEG